VTRSLVNRLALGSCLFLLACAAKTNGGHGNTGGDGDEGGQGGDEVTGGTGGS
jgi:hypothetical protein